MFTLLLLLATSATPPLKVAAPNFQIVGIEPAVGDALFDRFVTQFASTGEVRITTSRDIAQILGMERQKALLGCSDASSTCLAELAGALGADAVLSGNLVKVGTNYTATLRLIGGTDGRELAAATERLKDLDAMQDWLDAQAPKLAARLRVTFSKGANQPLETTSVSTSAGASPWPWVTAGGAAVVTGVGVAVFFLGRGDFKELQGSTDLQRIDALASSGPMKEQLGVGLMLGGGLATAGAIVWGVLAPKAPVVVTGAMSPQGAVIGLAGSLP